MHSSWQCEGYLLDAMAGRQIGRADGHACWVAQELSCQLLDGGWPCCREHEGLAISPCATWIAGTHLSQRQVPMISLSLSGNDGRDATGVTGMSYGAQGSRRCLLPAAGWQTHACKGLAEQTGLQWRVWPARSPGPTCGPPHPAQDTSLHPACMQGTPCQRATFPTGQRKKPQLIPHSLQTLPKAARPGPGHAAAACAHE